MTEKITRLVLTRRAAEGIEFYTAGEKFSLKVLSIFNHRVTCTVNEKRSFQLSRMAAPVSLPLGVTAQLITCSFGQCKMVFMAPESVSILRSELKPRASTQVECPGCKLRKTKVEVAAAKFDFDCSGCREYTLSQYTEVR
jgi:sRNA-binding carbon storage regulator CsrA